METKSNRTSGYVGVGGYSRARQLIPYHDIYRGFFRRDDRRGMVITKSTALHCTAPECVSIIMHCTAAKFIIHLHIYVHIYLVLLCLTHFQVLVDLTREGIVSVKQEKTSCTGQKW